MNEVVTINGNDLQVKMWNGQRIVSFKDVDRVHDRAEGTAHRNFKENKKHLIENEDSLYKMFNRGFLVDELFIPIFLNMHPKFKKRVFYEQKVTDAPDELQGNLRYINWWDGSPYVWRLSDYETLKNAKKMGHLFARKFDETVDESIINKIVKDCLK